MSARSSWSGAITFAGFPIPVKAYPLAKSASSDSFKTLCPCHGQPIRQDTMCATNGTLVDRADVRKGVELAKGVYHMLDAQVVEQIQGATKSVTIEPEKFCPLDTLPLHMATNGYVIAPESNLGADKPVAILRAALAKTNVAMVSRWTPRAGSRDSIIAVYAGPDGLLGITLPHVEQMNSIPSVTLPTVADAETAMFEQAMTTLYTSGPFTPLDFPSEYNARRKKAIEAAVAGQPVPTAATPVQAPVPDLMAALAASLANAPTKEKIAA
jgi:Ku protein